MCFFYALYVLLLMFSYLLYSYAIYNYCNIVFCLLVFWCSTNLMCVMMDAFSVCAVLWLSREKACSILTKTEACRTLKVRVLLSFNPLQTRSLHIKTCVPSPSTGQIYGTNMNKSRNTAACSTSFF